MSQRRTDQSAPVEGDETPLEMIVGGLTIGGILALAFGLLFLGVPWFWVVFPVGFAGALPVAIGLTKWYERNRRETSAASNPTEQETALETLRNRYARGEINEDEFEQRLSALLETETVDGATEYATNEQARD